MSKSCFCTIITADYGHFLLALLDSVEEFDNDIIFSVFITQGELSEIVERQIKKRKNLSLNYYEDLGGQDSLANLLRKKYSEEFHDAYRWGMKPIFLKYLLSKGFDKVIYVDSDIYFFNDYNFLFDQLENCNLLLSPHWRSSLPDADLLNFKLNFLDGIYNGGFIGATQGGIPALDYWARLCLFACEVNRGEGFYVDQRYLDILPTRFPKIDHIKHKGCNIGNWNQVDCKRTKTDNGEVLINDSSPIVFVHFTNSMLRGILYGDDQIMMPYLGKYRDNILKYSQIDIIDEFHKKGKFLKSRSEEDFHPKKEDISKSKIQKTKNILKKISRKLK